MGLRIDMVDPAAYSLPYDTGLCEALARRGHTVTLFTTRFAHGPMPEAHGFDIVEWFYPRSPRGMPRRAARALQHPADMRRLVRRWKRRPPDLAHVQWSVIDRFDIPLWRRTATRLPVVFTAHNALPREGRGESLSCDQLRAFSAVIAHSRWGAEGLRTTCALGDRAGDPLLERIPHGVLDLYGKCEHRRPPELASLDDGPVVALPGLLRPYKGMDVLLAAWRGVLDGVPEAQLVIAGRPMGMSIPTELPPRVHVVPRFIPDDEFGWIVGRADLVCLPYTAIDQSGVLFASLALHKPMVLSDVGGFAEFEGKGAVLVPAGQPRPLANALVDTLGDPERLKVLSLQAAQAASGEYDWNVIAAQHEELYLRLVDRSGGRSNAGRARGLRIAAGTRT